MTRHSLSRNGIASISDLGLADYDAIFLELEEIDTQFRKVVRHPPGYRWARDPLHTWSRVWEYPYVYHQLKELRRQIPESIIPRVMDFGSGVTFFPTAVASLGYDVICVDIDPAYAEPLEAASRRLNLNRGSVRAQTVTGDFSDLDESAYDCIYSVSVVEHIPECSMTVKRLATLLQTGGILILTFDLDLATNRSDGVPCDELDKLERLLEESFLPVYWKKTISPALMLTSENSPYSIPREVNSGRIYRFVRDRLVKPLLRRPVGPLFRLTCEGGTYRKV
jgi:hypothetical protein